MQKIKKTIISIFLYIIFGSPLWLFSAKLLFSPSGGNLLMYCPQIIDIFVENNDSDIASLDVMWDYNGTQIENIDFGIMNMSNFVASSLINEEIITNQRRLFAGTRKPNSIRPRSQNPLIGKFYFNNKYLQTQTDLSFFGLANTTNGDSNLSYGGLDWLEIPGGLGNASFEYVTGTCIPDNKAPEIPENKMSIIRNGAYRVSANSNFDFRIIDDSSTSVQYRYPTPDFTLTNYISGGAENVDNQYGVESGTITVKIDGYDYSDEFSLNGINNFSTISATGITRHQQDKGYDILVNPIRDFRIEEEINITIKGKDNTHVSKPLAYEGTKSITFNSPKSPRVIRSSLSYKSPQSNTLVDPELEEIIFQVEDDWAGVNSGSLQIMIFTGTSSSPYVNPFKTYNYGDTGFQLSGVTKSFSSNGILGSNAITHSLNYDITLTGFGKLPEYSYIRVVVNGEDFAYQAQNFNPNSFMFQTRKSCKSLQCGEGVAIYTGRSSYESIFYTETGLTISGGFNPYISGNFLFCSSPAYYPLSVYQNGTELNYGNSTGGTVILENFTGGNLNIEIVGGSAKIVGNTLYITKTPANCGNGIIESTEQCDDGNTKNGDGCDATCKKETGNSGGEGDGGGGGDWPTKDNCLLPTSTLEGANWLGLDYSPSFYDQTCQGTEQTTGTEIHEVSPLCEVNSTYDEKYETAYLYACKMGITTMNNIGDADLDGIVIRKHLAKMVSEYAIKFFNKQPDLNKKCLFSDMNEQDEEMQKYAKLSCQIGLMGLNSDGTPNIVFNPEGIVSIAEFGTTFSRLIYGNLYNTEDSKNWYKYHLNALFQDKLIEDISEPFVNAKRRQVMELIKRSDKTNFIGTINDKNEICSLSFYGEELEDAYLYACGIGITTQKTIKEADLYGKLLRKHLAKMVSVYATKILKKIPDTNKECNFSDISEESTEIGYRIQTSCQLGLMGLNFDGNTALKNFMPNQEVTRAQRATIFSRLIWGGKNNGDKNCRYCPHLSELQKHGIIKEIEGAENRIELRGFVMLMMQRASGVFQKIF